LGTGPRELKTQIENRNKDSKDPTKAAQCKTGLRCGSDSSSVRRAAVVELSFSTISNILKKHES
jgi:hypothetical protein